MTAFTIPFLVIAVVLFANAAYGQYLKRRLWLKQRQEDREDREAVVAHKQRLMEAALKSLMETQPDWEQKRYMK